MVQIIIGGVPKSDKIRFFLEFIYSEKAINFCQISTLDFSYVETVKFTVEISQNLMSFSEYMDFTNMKLFQYLSVYFLTVIEF